MHNYFIHKLVNPYDLNKIRKAVAFLNQNSMDTLTVLGPGECLVSGTGLNMPCFLRVDQLDIEHRPKSENVMLYGDGGIFNSEYDTLDL
jgi:DNA helicase HerA-like ATPase